ncbi:MAG: DNA primase [Bacteroidetes Order II. Incertae sedis bacterium]|nr:DNA primase [Bacteroidetes Order II. bacterium]MBT5250689.1 DNA primase [Bacteroidetes Order II. bacterium]MBT6201983.1 DNA primase [Bacteroidetes Order II. bacterium]MBT6425782.1 DNA primase [Bacteroidetes Order II. bacterium]MBT6598238.1 DNA primase [Bacteroidetes Order II. bacterium]
MSIIPETSIEEVRSSTDIVDVVGEYVQLKKRSSNFVGLCPFHNEKTPSFNVNPRMGIFKCFGCGEGGDVFSFVSRMESLSFPEAVRVLAERVGIVLPEEEVPGDDASESESIYHALRFAGRFFHDALLKDKEAQVARDYLKKRGFSSESIQKFGVGYAPDSWDALLETARKTHLEDDILEGAGLIIPRKERTGFYDRYRHRLMFPIFSHVGKVIGFGGRILREDDEPKYINSPETKVYTKSRVLYGLYQGKNAIRGKKEAIMVEGYTDVVSLHQAGVEHVVASSGTALTREQISMLGRYAEVIVLLYDADSAGLRAALRAIDLILEEGLIPYAVQLPEGEDPDSYVRENGGPAFETFLKQERQNFIEFVLTNATASGKGNTPEGMAAVQRTILQSIARIKDTLNREAYLRSAAKSLDIPDMQLRPILEEYVRGKGKRRPARREPEYERATADGAQAHDLPEIEIALVPAEKKLLRIMLGEGPSMIEWIMSSMSLNDFSKGACRSMAEELVRQYEADLFDRQAFFGPTVSGAVQSLAAEIMTEQDEPSENWIRKKQIPVPRLDENSNEAAASAMVYLKLVRIDEQMQNVLNQMKRAEQTGGDLAGVQQKHKQLIEFRKAVKERKFIADV